MRHAGHNRALGGGGGHGGGGHGGHGGGGHGGHGGHHGGRGFRGGGIWGGPGWDWGYPWYYDQPDVFVVAADSDDETTKRAMAYIMSLPKAQRAAAYSKIFGTPPAPGVLGDFDSSSAVKVAAVAVGGYLLYKMITKR